MENKLDNYYLLFLSTVSAFERLRRKHLISRQNFNVLLFLKLDLQIHVPQS